MPTISQLAGTASPVVSGDASVSAAVSLAGLCDTSASVFLRARAKRRSSSAAICSASGTAFLYFSSKDGSRSAFLACERPKSLFASRANAIGVLLGALRVLRVFARSAVLAVVLGFALAAIVFGILFVIVFLCVFGAVVLRILSGLAVLRILCGSVAFAAAVVVAAVSIVAVFPVVPIILAVALLVFRRTGTFRTFLAVGTVGACVFVFAVFLRLVAARRSGLGAFGIFFFFAGFSVFLLIILIVLLIILIVAPGIARSFCAAVACAVTNDGLGRPFVALFAAIAFCCVGFGHDNARTGFGRLFFLARRKGNEKSLFGIDRAVAVGSRIRLHFSVIRFIIHISFTKILSGVCGSGIFTAFA